MKILDILKCTRCFEGWPFVINDMALNNELIDVKPINLPDLESSVVENEDWYTFAGFFPAG